MGTFKQRNCVSEEATKVVTIRGSEVYIAKFRLRQLRKVQELGKRLKDDPENLGAAMEMVVLGLQVAHPNTTIDDVEDLDDDEFSKILKVIMEVNGLNAEQTPTQGD